MPRHHPLLERKSFRPESTDNPAPEMSTMRRAFQISSVARKTGFSHLRSLSQASRSTPRTRRETDSHHSNIGRENIGFRATGRSAEQDGSSEFRTSRRRPRHSPPSKRNRHPFSPRSPHISRLLPSPLKDRIVSSKARALLSAFILQKRSPGAMDARELRFG